MSVENHGVIISTEETSVRFQVLTAASMKFRIVFWDVLLCKIIINRRFRDTCCLHHQGWGKLVHQIFLAVLPAESSGSNQKEREKGTMNLTLWSTYVHTCKWYFTCRKVLRPGACGFTYLSKEGVLRTFIALKNSSPRLGLSQWTLGPVASSLTFIPPKYDDVAFS
jgi:hypothetical protein